VFHPNTRPFVRFPTKSVTGDFATMTAASFLIATPSCV
jgi:hypothetical protein